MKLPVLGISKITFMGICSSLPIHTLSIDVTIYQISRGAKVGFPTPSLMNDRNIP